MRDLGQTSYWKWQEPLLLTPPLPVLPGRRLAQAYLSLGEWLMDAAWCLAWQSLQSRVAGLLEFHQHATWQIGTRVSG